jgi:type III pantothenate kinase
VSAGGGAPSLLTIDRGHSTLDLMLHAGDRALARQRFAALEPGALERFLAPFAGAQAPRAALALTVVPGGLADVGAALARRGVVLRVAGADVPCPLRLAYPRPETLGVDRWVGALAAHRRFRAAIVADCGTALTLNAVTADGTFAGGAIAPGAGTMREGLRRRAPRLPPADLDARAVLPAVTSQDAVDAGVLLAFAGAVERLAADLAAATGLEHAQRVVTGGEAPLYLAHARAEWVHAPDLVHEGLRWLSRSNG